MREKMTYIIAEYCVGTKETACVDVRWIASTQPRIEITTAARITKEYRTSTKCPNSASVQMSASTVALACRSAP